jgi:hypothetical protein
MCQESTLKVASKWGMQLISRKEYSTYMRKIFFTVLMLLVMPFETPHAFSETLVSAPILQKVYVNSDSMQAVLYWTPVHSVPENPVLDYAATIDGTNFTPLSLSYQKKYQVNVSLPVRATKTTYFFAIAPVLKNGLGPISNIIKGEINPYPIPISIGEISPTTDGFTFEIKDISFPGYSASTSFVVSDISGSDSAFFVGETKMGFFEIGGLSKGEKATITVYKKVGNCSGFSVALVCPYSSATLVTGSAAQELQAPKFGQIESLSDGFTTTILNFDQGVRYVFDAPQGITATVDMAGHVEVHGLGAGSTAKLAVSATYSGYAAANSVLFGSSLDSAYIPAFASAKSLKSGFVIQISNFNSKFQHKVSSNLGKVSVNASGAITVTGLGEGVSANVSLKVYQEEKLIFETSLSGQAIVKKK